jgi:threonine synthase
MDFSMCYHLDKSIRQRKEIIFMRYQSTRDKSINLKASGAIAQGLARDGGLFVPENFPVIEKDAILKMTGMTYRERAVTIMSMFLDDFSVQELSEFAENAYSTFAHPEVTPVRKTDENTFFLELWHGPTCAFKDVALQMLPYLLTASLTKTGESRDVCILVATSGDTGKAALEGFCDVPHTKIIVFYPRDGVSDIQKLQMTTQKGENVYVSSVHGNFDDAQTGVKAIFSDEKLRETLSSGGYFLSSANSINWGRLLPQIVYYFSAYCDLVKGGTIKNGEEINFCVPTGNFGNILAGFYAKRMGLPVNKLICASNCNDVLTQFIETGVYDRNRTFYTTISPSMDILVSSNLERLLFELSEKDDVLIKSYMEQLSREGRYEVNDQIKEAVGSVFKCGQCTDEETKAVIKETFDKLGYLIDTHTAVAVHVLKKYREQTKETTPCVVVSTASPYKFCDSVLNALGVTPDADGFKQLERLSALSKTEIPVPLKSLRNKTVRFEECVEKEDMHTVVEKFLL